MITKKLLVLIILSALNISGLNAEVLEKAELILKINLKKAPTSRPQTVAYIPVEKKYYIADGGLAPMGSATEAPMSKSLIHTYDETGKYIESTRAGFDNRSIYFNQKEARLETISVFSEVIIAILIPLFLNNSNAIPSYVEKRFISSPESV